MERRIFPHPLGGSICAIPSKSQAHRLLICAALSDGETVIHCPQTSADIEATAGCLRSLGSAISYEKGCYRVLPIRSKPEHPCLDCSESGSTLRFLLPVAAALGGRTDFLLRGRLAQRPLSPLWEEMERHGCTLSRPREDLLRCEGTLTGGSFRLAGNISSQFISGLLFALPLLKEPSDIMLTTPLESVGYVEMTKAALAAFDHRYHSHGSYRVEGDWSNAAFWLCAGALSRPVTVKGLSPDSPQGDRQISSLLEAFGAKTAWTEEGFTVSPAPLHGIDIDAGDIPDLVPPLALLAACAKGRSRIYNARRLRIKESDRLQSVAHTLNALGGQVEITSDGLNITGGTLTGGRVDSYNDHRIAMLAAIASCVCQGEVQLTGSGAVNKSYPRFWEDFAAMQMDEERSSLL